MNLRFLALTLALALPVAAQATPLSLGGINTRPVLVPVIGSETVMPEAVRQAQFAQVGLGSANRVATSADGETVAVFSANTVMAYASGALLVQPESPDAYFIFIEEVVGVSFRSRTVMFVALASGNLMQCSVPNQRCSLFEELRGGPIVGYVGHQELGAYASSDERVYLFRATSSDQENLGRARDGATALAINRSGSHIAVGTGSGTVRVYQLEDGASDTLHAHEGPATAVAVSDDGRYVASGGMDNWIRVTDRETGSRLVQGVHFRWPSQVHFTAGDSTLISAGNDGDVYFWRPQEGRESIELLIGLGELPISGMALDEVGGRFYLTSSGSTLHIHDFNQLAQQYERVSVSGPSDVRRDSFANSDPGAFGEVSRHEIWTPRITAATIQADTGAIITGHDDGRVLRWRPAQPGADQMGVMPTSVEHLATSQDGQITAAVDGSGTIDLFTSEGPASRLNLNQSPDGELAPENRTSIGDVVVFQNKVFLGTDDAIFIADAETNRIRIFDLPGVGFVSHLAARQNDVVLGSTEGRITLFDVDSNRALRIQDRDAPVAALATDQSENILYAFADGVIVLNRSYVVEVELDAELIRTILPGEYALNQEFFTAGPNAFDRVLAASEETTPVVTFPGAIADAASLPDQVLIAGESGVAYTFTYDALVTNGEAPEAIDDPAAEPIPSVQQQVERNEDGSLNIIDLSGNALVRRSTEDTRIADANTSSATNPSAASIAATNPSAASTAATNGATDNTTSSGSTADSTSEPGRTAPPVEADETDITDPEAFQRPAGEEAQMVRIPRRDGGPRREVVDEGPVEIDEAFVVPEEGGTFYFNEMLVLEWGAVKLFGQVESIQAVCEGRVMFRGHFEQDEREHSRGDSPEILPFLRRIDIIDRYGLRQSMELLPLDLPRQEALVIPLQRIVYERDRSLDACRDGVVEEEELLEPRTRIAYQDIFANGLLRERRLFDELGRRTEIQVFEVDSRNQQLERREVFNFNDSQGGYHRLVYDRDEDLVEEEVVDSEQNTISLSRYAHFDHGEVQEEVFNNRGIRIAVNYRTHGVITRQDRYNRVGDYVGFTTYEYSDRGRPRLTTIHDLRNGRQEVLTYDQVGQLVQREVVVSGEVVQMIDYR